MARLADPDRFLSVLFAPPAVREALFVLIAFNHETVRAVEIARSSRGEHGTVAGLIRLQWWRDVIEGRADPGRHEVALPLRRVLASGGTIEPTALEAVLRAREAELEGPWGLAECAGAMADGPGGLAVAIAGALGVPAELHERIRAIGRAYGIGAVLRHREALAAAGRRLWPDEVPVDVPDPLSALGRDALGSADAPALTRALPRRMRAAVLLAPLARRDLARAAWPASRRTTARLAGDRLAMLAAFLF